MSVAKPDMNRTSPAFPLAQPIAADEARSLICRSFIGSSETASWA